MRRREHEGTHERQPGRVRGHHEGRDPLVALRWVGRGKHGIEIGETGVRDEGLGAREHVTRAVPPRARRDRRGVRAGLDLGQREGRHGPARERRGDPAVLERAVAGKENRDGAEGLQREHRVGERGGACQRFAHQTCGAQIEVSDRRKPSCLAEAHEQLPCLDPCRSVVRGLGEGREFGGGVGRHPRRQGDVRFREERADGGRVRHGQTNLGWRFALNAS